MYRVMVWVYYIQFECLNVEHYCLPRIDRLRLSALGGGEEVRLGGRLFISSN